MKTNLTTLAVALVGVAWIIAEFWDQPWPPMRVAGAIIGLPSFALLVLARIQLGGSSSVRAKAHALVTHGFYSRIRNPIYVFGGLAIAGIFLFLGRPKLLWTLVAIIPLQIYGARKEEQVLTAQFGDEYRAYKARTGF